MAKVVDEKIYSEKEAIEIVRQVLYYGTPEYYENGGVTGSINFPPNGTHKKATDYYNKYFKNKKS